MHMEKLALEKKMLGEHQARELNKETLVAAKERIEGEIARFEKKEFNDHSRNLLHNLHELTAALSTMQEMMNLIWKRTEQMQEELAQLRSKTE